MAGVKGERRGCKSAGCTYVFEIIDGDYEVARRGRLEIDVECAWRPLNLVPIGSWECQSWSRGVCLNDPVLRLNAFQPEQTWEVLAAVLDDGGREHVQACAG